MICSQEILINENGDDDVDKKPPLNGIPSKKKVCDGAEGVNLVTSISS